MASGVGWRAMAALSGATLCTCERLSRDGSAWLPRRGVHALQLEIAQGCYMDEASPYRWDAVRAAALGTALRQLVSELLAWRPEGNVSG